LIEVGAVVESKIEKGPGVGVVLVLGRVEAEVAEAAEFVGEIVVVMVVVAGMEVVVAAVAAGMGTAVAGLDMMVAVGILAGAGAAASVVVGIAVVVPVVRMSAEGEHTFEATAVVVAEAAKVAVGEMGRLAETVEGVVVVVEEEDIANTENWELLDLRMIADRAGHWKVVQMTQSVRC
jgi:hypothetical protein